MLSGLTNNPPNQKVRVEYSELMENPLGCLKEVLQPLGSNGAAERLRASEAVLRQDAAFATLEREEAKNRGEYAERFPQRAGHVETLISLGT